MTSTFGKCVSFAIDTLHYSQERQTCPESVKTPWSLYRIYYDLFLTLYIQTECAIYQILKTKFQLHVNVYWYILTICMHVYFSFYEKLVEILHY